MGAASRTKGKSGELEAAKLLRRWFPGVERNLTETREGQGVDLCGTAPFAVQVKRYAVVTPGVVLSAWQEAVDGVDNHTGPEVKYALVLHRSDRQPGQVTVDVRDIVTMHCGNGPRASVLGQYDAESFFAAWEANGRPR